MHHAEIGGYLELEHFDGREYYPDAVALNCARNAFAYLIEARHIHDVWIPWFVCASVEQAAGRYDLDVHRYAVDNRLRPDWSTIELGPEGYLYLIDYYGLLSDDEIREAAARADNRIVVDEVMAFFHKPVDGLDTIYSTRKFFGVPDGAYLSTDAHIDRELPTDESFDRMRFVLGRFERSANEFYQLASDNNKFFITEDIKLMSPLTHNILRAVDYPRVMSIRERNYAYLRTRLDGINGLSVCDHPGPFMYPLLIEGAGRSTSPLSGLTRWTRPAMPPSWRATSSHFSSTSATRSRTWTTCATRCWSSWARRARASGGRDHATSTVTCSLT